MRQTLFAPGATVTCTIPSVIAVVACLLAAAPVQARFALEVAGLPVAELRISVTGDLYVYESTHFLEEGPREHHVEITLKEGNAAPEVLALLHRPKLGCIDVLEERGKQLEKLCITRSVAGEAVGTINKQMFTARYDPADTLTGISVGSAKWIAAPQPVQPPGESPFVHGLAVPPGELRLDPPLEGAKWLSKAPIGVGQEDLRRRCLLLARDEVTRRPGSEIAVGLVIEDGRAYPHAWVTQKGASFDPSVVAGDPILVKRRYLQIPNAKSGEFYLRLFDGAVRLVAK